MNLPLTRPQAILFDLDGTLLDSAPDLAEAANLMRRQRQLPEVAYALLRPQASKGARGLVGTAFGVQAGDPEYEELRVEFLRNYEQAMAVQSRLFDGVPELLASLHKSGITWGIVTNKLARFTDALLPQVGLAHAACAISGDTASHPKPHPAPLFAAAEKLGLPAHACWYVGDDARDIEAGRAAGMRTLAAAWGYCETQEIANWQADHVVHSPAELAALLPAAS